MSGKSNKSGKESWELSSSDDDFYKAFREAELAKRKVVVKPIDIITDFLKTTDIPYIVVGGKAAIYHLNKIPNIKSSSSKRLAKSSEDYDIVCKQKNSKKFIESLGEKLINSGVEMKEVEMKNENITMIGHNKKGIFDSLIDIHIPKVKITIKGEKGDDGITYASLDYVCEQLENELKNKGSALEVLKFRKRETRYKLLCKK